MIKANKKLFEKMEFLDNQYWIDEWQCAAEMCFCLSL